MCVYVCACMRVCVRVCVCVCRGENDRERERGSERVREREKNYIFFNKQCTPNWARLKQLETVRAGQQVPWCFHDNAEIC